MEIENPIQDSGLGNDRQLHHEARLESDTRNDEHEDDAGSDGQQSSSSVIRTGMPGADGGDINAAAALRAQYAIDVSEPSRGGRRRRQKRSVATTPATASNSSSLLPSKPKSTSSNSHQDEHDTRDNDDCNNDNEPLIDTTVTLPLHSKKTSRLQRKQERRTAQALLQSQTLGPVKASLLSIPTELLFLVLSHLRPSDIPKVHLVCTSLHTYLSNPTTNTLLSQTIIQSRYWVLSQCFPLPIPLHSLDTTSQTALLLPKRQELMFMHHKSYRQHILPINPEQVCTCMTCMFAWNNLCLILDLHHWQKNLDNREPIPMIKRGRNPDWNNRLLERNAQIVRRAAIEGKDKGKGDPLVYAWILEKHLDTTVRTILRNSRWESKRNAYNKKLHFDRHATSATSSSSSSTPVSVSVSSSSSSHKTPNTTLLDPCSPTHHLLPSQSSSPPQKSQTRTYDLHDSEILHETDEFLQRKGPASYDFPYHRDNYYDIEVYLPNRKWNSAARKWGYYATPPAQHEKDLEWVRGWSARTMELKRGILMSGGGTGGGTGTGTGTGTGVGGTGGRRE